MRPVSRPAWPQLNGINIVFTDWKEAYPHLTKALGLYCSYCEMHLSCGLEIEHIQAKSLAKYAHLTFDWNNFLLSCKLCNSNKSNKDTNYVDFYWPHIDNTIIAFDYSVSGMVTVSSTLSPTQRDIALKTIDLTKFDANPITHITLKQDRYIARLEAYSVAQRALSNYVSVSISEMVEIIADLAMATGFFSVWMNVFQAHPIMLRRLILAFNGTDQHSFDANGLPVARSHRL